METTTEKNENGVLIVSLNGRLDATTSSGLTNELSQLIASGEHKILINFEKLEYISSAGLRVLITTVKLLKAKQGKLILSNMSSGIFEVLRVSGFSKILNINETQEEALANF